MPGKLDPAKQKGAHNLIWHNQLPTKTQNYETLDPTLTFSLQGFVLSIFLLFFNFSYNFAKESAFVNVLQQKKGRVSCIYVQPKRYHNQS